MMKRYVVVSLAALLLLGCAPGINEQVGTASASGAIAGFWLGLWHGMICPVTFLFSLFDHSVQIYEVHNNGAFYNLGYLIGATAFHGGGHAARRRAWGARERGRRM